jgi:uncharacterized oxidoreductase
MLTMKLDDKRVLITGGSSGIGLGLARAMLERGAQVVITGRREAALRAALADLSQHGNGKIAMFTGDVGKPADRDAMLSFAISQMGGLDVLVNNAGGVRAGRLENITEEEITAMIEVDLLAPILLTRKALPELRKCGNALVLNISSSAALLGVPFYGTYAAAKAGLARFGEGLRRELKGEGVHVMTVYPVATDTPMMASSEAGPDLGFGRESVADVVEAVIAGVEADALEVRRGGEKRAEIFTLNWEDPIKLDVRFAELKPALEVAIRDHKAL